jgi:hypothetical protein
LESRETGSHNKTYWFISLIYRPFSKNSIQVRDFFHRKKYAKCIIAKDLHLQILSLKAFRRKIILLIHRYCFSESTKIIFLLEQDKCVRNNRSNIDFPFIKALEFDLKHHLCVRYKKETPVRYYLILST